MSELAAVVKMVDEVVKPLLAIQKALQKTEHALHQAQADALNASYQLSEVYEGFDKNCKMIAERNADLEMLTQHFTEAVSELKKVPKKIDKSVQDGVRGASGDLTQAVNEQLTSYLKSKVDVQVQYLNKSVEYARDKLSDYQAMTWTMHAKMIAIAIVCGVAVGSIAFFGLSYTMKHALCECRCSAPVCVCPPVPPVPPSPSALAKPEEPMKKSQPARTLQRPRYR